MKQNFELNILITGANGFLGKNLLCRLNELNNFSISILTKSSSLIDSRKKISEADFIFHLAGENRSERDADFIENNHLLTKLICGTLLESKKTTPVVFSSSTQVKEKEEGIYGKTKRLAEKELESLQKNNSNHIVILRLPGIFGKWSKPNYNSVVSTFCYKAANDEELEIHHRDTPLILCHVDDVIERLISILDDFSSKKEIISGIFEFDKTYSITIKELASKIQGFSKNRETQILDKISSGFDKALYSTFLSYLPKSKYHYSIDKNSDDRGIFTEFLKSEHFGQISFFTINPGSTRGMHYHHQKIEKFLVLQGTGEFTFEDILTKERNVFVINEEDFKVIETIPGLSHSIKNISDEKLIVLAYANEVFDKLNPDTYHYEIKNGKA